METWRTNAIFAAYAVCLLLAVACGRDNGKNTQASIQEKRITVPDSSALSAKSSQASPEDTRLVIVAFGDSLTAGVVQNTYPEYLQEILDKNGYKYRVENQGVSGDTTTDGSARIGNVISSRPALVILEFGGNDGLRGIPVESTKQNLAEMITRLKQARIPVVLLGITLPPNYGPDYVQPFTQMFPDLAKKDHIRVLPFLLMNVYQHPDMMQPDGIHPNGRGNLVVAQDVFKFIAPVLSAPGRRKHN